MTTLPESTGVAAPAIRLRPTLTGLPIYRAGSSDPSGVKLSANENPFPPLPGVLEAARAALSHMNRYPDTSSTEMLAAIAETISVPADRLATGTGSVGLLQQIVQSIAGEGDEVVFAWRSFEAYPLVVQVSGATAIPVPLTTSEHHDLDAMAAAITPRTRLVLLCSPNNPTGTVITRRAMQHFMSRIPRNVLVVLDEAYVDFVRDSDAVDGLHMLDAHHNLCLLRTFSKAHGLAGLRVGYSVSAPEVAAALRATAVPFGVSAAAHAAVIASLAVPELLAERVEAIVAERERIVATLRAHGYTVPDTQANFIWLRLGQSTPEIAEQLARAGLIVRPFGSDGLRITVGERTVNDRLIHTLISTQASICRVPRGAHRSRTVQLSD